ncbi:MAG: S8 family serine peptidase [Deltaproteobacteria bacterium]|nr:S8 family serine peptidase [Deltaproteobacteria bacterium]
MRSRFPQILSLLLFLAVPAVAGELPDLSEAPREVLVRFNDQLEFCAQTGFAHRGTVPTLDLLFEALEVTAVQAVFRSSSETLRLAQGSSLLSIETLRQEHDRVVVQANLSARVQGQTVALPELFHIYRFSLGGEQDPSEVVDRLKQDPRVIFAEPNHLYRQEALPRDRYVDGDGDESWESGSWSQPYSDLWGLEASEWDQVWDQRSSLWQEPPRIGGGGVTVAVVDTGVDVLHPDLAANIWRDAAGNPGRDVVDIDLESYLDRGFVAIPGEDYATQDFEPTDRNGHGTHVSGTIAAVADNGIGIAGVAWNSSLMPIRAGFAISTSNGGNFGLLESDDIAVGLMWAADNGADIINMSFGGSGSETIGIGVEYAASLGVVLVASAGNRGIDTSAAFPASHPAVMAVGALDASGKRARFSNTGRLVSLASPGVDVLSLKAQGTALSGEEKVVDADYVRSDGTSMAAPHVAGAAALVLSLYPSLSTSEVRSRLEGSSRDHGLFTAGSSGNRQSFGHGQLDLFNALDASVQPVLKVTSWRLRDDPTDPANNGNGLAESAENITFSPALKNVWVPASGLVTLTLTTSDPFIEITDGTRRRNGWSNTHSHIQVFSFTVAPGAPDRHRGELKLHVQGDGWEQQFNFPITINPPAPFPISLDDHTPPTSDVNLTPQIAADAAGGTVVVWHRQKLTEGETEIRARLLTPEGEFLGEDFLVDKAGRFQLSSPTTDRNDSGAIVVVWIDRTDDTTPVVAGRLFTAVGNPASPVLELYRDPDLPPIGGYSVAMDDEGGFTVAWTVDIGAERDIFVRRFAADGSPLGSARPVGPNSAGSPRRPAITHTGDGEMVVVWIQVPGTHVMAQRFDASGDRVGSETRINQEPSGFDVSPDVTWLPNGSFLVVWKGCTPPSEGLVCTIKSRAFDRTQSPWADEVIVSDTDDLYFLSLGVAADSSGQAMVTWDGCPPASNAVADCGVFYRFLNPFGGPDSEVVEDLSPGGPLFPSVGSMEDGFLLSWDDQDGSPTGVFALVVSNPRTGSSICDAEDPNQMCLREGRFQVSVEWEDHSGNSGVGNAINLTDQSGAFWFFRPGNVELLVKVLDGGLINGHWWVFSASLSNVEYTLTVTDTATGLIRNYRNPSGALASFGDTMAFAIEAPSEEGNSSLPSLDTRSVKPSLEALAQSLPALQTLPEAGEAPLPCVADSETLCLNGSRFSALVQWTDPQGNTGSGTAVALTEDSGYFTFFNEANIELVVKVLDGRPVNGQWWVFYASLSNVDYTLTVTDRVTGAVKVYNNPPNTFASSADLEAF